MMRQLFLQRRIGVLVFFLLGKGDTSLVSLFKSWLMWEFPVVVEHEDGWSNKEGLWKLPNLAFLTFLIFLRTYLSPAIYSANSFWVPIMCQALFKVLEIYHWTKLTKNKNRKNVCRHGAYLLMFQRPSLPVPRPIPLLRKVLKLRSDVVLL